MKNFFSVSLLLMILALFAGCDKKNKYDPTKGKELLENIKKAEGESDSLQLAKYAVDQYRILKDRNGAMATMSKAMKFCSDIQDPRQRIETYSQIAVSYSVLNAMELAGNNLKSAMNAYQNWEDEQAEMDKKRKKAPTQAEIETIASDKIEILVNLARAQMEIVPVDAQKSLMLAKDQVNLFSDVLMKVEKLLDLAEALGKMESFENLQVVSAEVQAYLNGEVPETAKPQEEAPADEEAGDADSSADENTEVAQTEETPEEKKNASDEKVEMEEIDSQQKAHNLSRLAEVFIKMKHKDAKPVGIKILDEATEVAKTIDNKGKKAITLCEIAVNYATAKENKKAKALVSEADPLAKAADSATRETADEALSKAKKVVGE